mmetsp:Transcript_3427/g.7971  ORF Transcript_3427/g.7971 Transcript_3427/m.7971 type:complete len:107 (+) Transcript_3427:129-449(+)
MRRCESSSGALQLVQISHVCQISNESINRQESKRVNKHLEAILRNEATRRGQRRSGKLDYFPAAGPDATIQRVPPSPLLATPRTLYPPTPSSTSYASDRTAPAPTP